MQSKQKIRRCFFIGPMRDMSKMHAVRDNILIPLLQPHNFTVITPDEGEIGNIMRLVLLNLEQADLLIADITGNNPNVMYELGVYHSFGKPYLVIRDSNASNNHQDTPFDIAEYRYHAIDYADIEGSKLKMKVLLDNILAKIEKIDWFGNPVTDFYQSPVAEIPTAVGLSKNYKKNFLQMILPHLFQKNERGTEYKIDAWVETGEKDERGTPRFRELTDEERKTLRFEVYIPVKMSMARHEYIFDLKDIGRTTLKLAEVSRKSRPFKMYSRTDENGKIVLVDIPTVLSTLNDSILQRRRLHEDQIASEEWEILEAQELERFAVKCETFKKEMENNYPVCNGKIKIEWYWNPEKEVI